MSQAQFAAITAQLPRRVRADGLPTKAHCRAVETIHCGMAGPEDHGVPYIRTMGNGTPRELKVLIAWPSENDDGGVTLYPRVPGWYWAMVCRSEYAGRSVGKRWRYLFLARHALRPVVLIPNPSAADSRAQAITDYPGSVSGFRPSLEETDNAHQ